MNGNKSFLNITTVQPAMHFTVASIAFYMCNENVPVYEFNYCVLTKHSMSDIVLHQ